MSAYETITVERIGGALGAVVDGVDLTQPMTSAQQAEVTRALVAHEVVFFRDQPIDAAQQLAFAGQFGSVSLYPIERLFGSPEPHCQVIVDSADNPPATDMWHTDVSWLTEPPAFAFLTALEIPSHGGDTMWTSTTAAHDVLSPVMQSLLAGLAAVHSCHTGFVRIATAKNPVEGLGDRLREAYPEMSHPLVRTHPLSGRRSLYITATDVMHRIEGMTDAESEALFAFLARHIDQPQFAIRWHWRPGDLAVWDERTTLHRGVGDHFPLRRVVRRCTVDGERPFFDADRVPDPRYLASLS
jgi:taurine dioxygenase